MKILFSFIMILLACHLNSQVCYNNATPSDADSGILGFVTNTDSDMGCDGLAISELQFTTQGMTDFGFGSKQSAPRTIADDFTISEAMTLSIVKLYPFRLNIQGVLPSAEIIEEVYIRIWNGPPGSPGSSVVHGDLITNVLVSSTFSGVYRTNDVIDNSCRRPIREVIVDLNCILLNPGTYWIEWQYLVKVNGVDFSPIYNSVPLTTMGVTTTGNAVTSMNGGVTYVPVLDSQTKTGQGFPFIIESKPLPNPVPALGEWGLICLSLLLLIMGVTSIKQAGPPIIILSES